MKAVVLLFAVAIYGISGFLIKVPTVPSSLTEPTSSHVGWVHLQKLILPLFENVCEESTNPTIVRLAEEFITTLSNEAYLKLDVINNFQNLRTGEGLLPKGVIFTEYTIKHLNELKIIYEVLYYAKDFDTFYKATAWARQNLNCGLFIDVLYLALLNRKDTEKLSVPAPYELLPHYFIQKDIIVKASALLSGEEIVLSDIVRDEGNAYILDANYTANYTDNDEESKLAYFHEDIGLNSFYFLNKLRKAPWFNKLDNVDSKFGEYLYHALKQMSTRYSLERYSNGLPDKEIISWDTLTINSYDPLLIYSNGEDFGHRKGSLEILSSSVTDSLQTIENNIASVITHTIDIGYNKTQILNNLMEILVTGDNSYETLARQLIGKDISSNSQPSVMEHYMTSLRDPVFWKLNKKIIAIVDNALARVLKYTRNELYFPGLEIKNVDVKKMMTMFEYFQFDVTDTLKTATTNTSFHIKIGQQRLSHKPFSIKLSIASLVTQKGLIKLYLGPKVAPGEFAANKNLFMLLDCFDYTFHPGVNVVTRMSEKMLNLSDDFTSMKVIWKNVLDTEFGLDPLPLRNMETLLGFPSRLIVPKGTPEGLPVQIFAFVAPLVKTTFDISTSLPKVEYNAVALTPGYPLDLDIRDTQLLDLPNAMIKDFTITHKSSKPFGESRDFTKTKPYDYSLKKGQYGIKREYSFTEKIKENPYPITVKDTALSEFPDNSVGKIYLDEDTAGIPLYKLTENDNKEVGFDRPVLLLPFALTPSKRSTVYDYLINTNSNYNDESEDLKVYE